MTERPQPPAALDSPPSTSAGWQSDRLQSDRLQSDRLQSDRLQSDRLQSEREGNKVSMTREGVRQWTIPAEHALNSDDARKIDTPSTKPALERAAQTGAIKVGLLLSGQGVPWLERCRQLHAESPRARALLRHLSTQLEAIVIALPTTVRFDAFPAGFNVERWCNKTLFDEAPSAAERDRPALSAPGTMLAQLLAFAALEEAGLRETLRKEHSGLVLGHSAGALAAACLSSTLGFDKIEDRAAAALPWLTLAVDMGLRMEEGRVPAADASLRASAIEAGCGAPTPMAAVDGLLTSELEALLQQDLTTKANDETAASLSAIHGPTEHTLAGTPAALERFRLLLEARASTHQKAKRQRKAAGRSLEMEWTYLPVRAPFHSPLMTAALSHFEEDIARVLEHHALVPFSVPVVDPATGDLLTDPVQALPLLARSIFTLPMNWRRCLSSPAAKACTLLIDLGPTDACARLSAKALRGQGVTLVASAEPKGLEALLDADTLPQARRRPYAAFAPVLETDADGVRKVSNRFTRATGCSPIVLPGMTPTTVEAPIVVAAANAGHFAELAGGGQVTERILRLRLEEIVEGLEPGRGIIFNALYLDPYLWGLHFSEQGLVPRLKAEGYPIVGVTVSAGIPPLDEAVALLERLQTLGITLNAFKPGTSAQVAEVLAIAERCDDDLFLHLEGGRAGGHHSFEALDDLLLRNYDAIRKQENLVLAVGGGIGDETKASAYLTGAWSEVYDHPPMPVDAVLLGTRLMATKEACTSLAVKEALVEAAGEECTWPLDGKSAGGVTSGRSSLDASIYYLDNDAARAGALLDEVAGDLQSVTARRAEIVEALSKTAKPFFGDPTSMTYLAFLQRWVELTATGQQSRYEDGIWPDASFRSRFEALLMRAEERLLTESTPSIFSDVAGCVSDDPMAAIAKLVAAFPQAATLGLHPEDATFFISVCRRAGKPVPFVPVLDENVRRWYKSDSLAQCHDERFAANQVLTIPGPAALRGITRVNEPVADVLQGFVAHLERGLNAASNVANGTPAGLGHVATGQGGHQQASTTLAVTDALQNDVRSWRQKIRVLVSGPLAEALFSPNAFSNDGLIQQNPLRELVLTPAPGHTLEITNNEDGDTASLTYRDHEGTKTTSLAMLNGELDASVWLSAAGSPRPLPLHLSLQIVGGKNRLFCDRASYLKDQRKAFSSVIAGAELTGPAPFASCTHKALFDIGAVRRFRSATDDDTEGTPLGFAFVLAWPAIFRALSGAPGDLFRLLHEDNTVEQAIAWPPQPGDDVVVESKVVSLEDTSEGRRVRTVATLQVAERGRDLATVTSTFFIREQRALTPGTRRDEGMLHATLTLASDAARTFLAGMPWLSTEQDLPLGRALTFSAKIQSVRSAQGQSVHRAEGTVSDGDRIVATIRLTGTDALRSSDEHPCSVVLDQLGATPIAFGHQHGRQKLGLTKQLDPPVFVGSKVLQAPTDLRGYAFASGDRNPLHLDAAVARLAGFGAPIVHGMWTAAAAAHRAVRLAGDNDATRVQSVAVQFLAPLERGATLQTKVERVAQRGRSQVLSVEASCAEMPIAQLQIKMKPRRCAYVYPGQGTHAVGMGMEGFDRSPAARNVWESADAFAAAELGFSLLHVVKENPRELWVLGERFFHQQGVLFLTQFTQVALAVLAVAQTAELDEAGLIDPDACYAGHSLGEYSALAALGGVLPLHDVVAIVYQRGLTMDRIVERDEEGRSAFSMGVVRPHLVKMNEKSVFALINKIADETDQPLEVVNYNISGRQYTVTGHIRSMSALREALGEAFVEVPGIDVPFHSSLLRRGVDAFRERLDQALPDRVEAERLCGRYHPNLTGTVFALEPNFFAAIDRACGTSRAAAWEDRVGDDDDLLAREILVELLAWQFASPVQWIQTQASLFAPAARPTEPSTLIEIGAAHAPTLVGMARSTLRHQHLHHVEVLHAELDRDRLAGPSDLEVDGSSQNEADVKSGPTTATQEHETLGDVAPVTVQNLEVPLAPDASGVVADDNADLVRSGLTTVLSLLSKRPRNQMGDEQTLDGIAGGNSARRNQILADMGQEFQAPAIDGAHELPLTALMERLAQKGAYRGEGGFLQPQIATLVSRRYAPHGVDRDAIEHHLGKWSVPKSHQLCVLHELLLVSKDLAGDGRSAPKSKGEVLAEVEHVLQSYGIQHGFRFALISQSNAEVSVDAGALSEVKAEFKEILARGGSALAEAFGVELDRGPALRTELVASDADRVLSAGLDAEIEHGEGHLDAISRRFDNRTHIAFTSAWAWARRDLLDLEADLLAGKQPAPAKLESLSVRLDAEGRAMAQALAARHPAHHQIFLALSAPTGSGLGGVEVANSADQALALQGAFCRTVALVTGAGPGSIALSAIGELLAGGAKVVATTSSYGPKRVALMKALYQERAVPGSELHLVPCNQGSFADIDKLTHWLAERVAERIGSTERTLKAPLVPNLLLPFAAYPETGDLTSVGPRSLTTLRVNLLGVERLIAKLAPSARANAEPLHVVLPLSPNHGSFGGDGAYGESKASLEVLLNKWKSEYDAWGHRVSLVGVEIGWVRGTGLMKGNDSLASALEAEGLKTFSANEMATLIVTQCKDDARERAQKSPLRIDLSGGLSRFDDVGGKLRSVRNAAMQKQRHQQQLTALQAGYRDRCGDSGEDTASGVGAGADLSPRPYPEALSSMPTKSELETLPDLQHLDLDEVVVVCGFGEVSPLGSARSRWAIERGGKLSLEAVAELAWTMGLVKPDPAGDGFVDADSGELVPDAELPDRYEATIFDHSGVRITDPDGVGFDPNRLVQMVEIHLDRDFTFNVPSREVAEAMQVHAPEHTEIFGSDEGGWSVRRQKGAVLKVPSSLKIERHVSGQLPKGWDPTRFGLSPEMVAQVDPVTLYCLVSTAEAFLAAGLEPEEVYETLHPRRVGITLGTGIGGMKKLMRLHRDHYDGEERQNDTLQETLINVIGGYVVQSYLGSYGPMSFPVGACATAGLSVAEGVDKIRRQHCDLVVAGGADDLSEAGLVGFADMGATADTRDLEARGVEPKKMSRPSDTRRRGFVEAQGAGVLLLARGSLAVKLGLPVHGIVAYAGTSGDGLQRSVPAPGQGALVAGSGIADDQAFARRREKLRRLEASGPALAELLGETEAKATLGRARKELAHYPECERPGLSPLAAALSVLGLVGDDVAVVSKHDSSTQANDENEARLHAQLARALGRTPHLPLPVVSQKALTGHPKGAAAAWQLNGLMQMMAEGILPGHPCLDDVSAELAAFAPLVASDRPRHVPRSSLRAGIVTTLGFGHVSALVCVAHPFLFWRMLGDKALKHYRQRLAKRLRVATTKLQSLTHESRPLITIREERPFKTLAEEQAFLLDADARYLPSGVAHNAP